MNGGPIQFRTNLGARTAPAEELVPEDYSQMERTRRSISFLGCSPRCFLDQALLDQAKDIEVLGLALREEAVHSVLHRIEHLEHRVELCHQQQFQVTLAGIHQLERAALRL